MNKELVKFIVEAKRSSFASGNSPVRLEDGLDEFVYENGVYKYRDRYFGSESFVGQEIVFQDNRLVWAMNYIGGIKDSSVNLEEVYQFLRESLSHVSIEEPFRGPNFYQGKKLAYTNSVSPEEITYWNSTIGQEANFFMGREVICVGFKEVYECLYHGGLIQ